MIIRHGDCIAEMSALLDEGVRVDAVVCDPPYELGFMGKGWDSTGIANRMETWLLAFELLKPGGHLLAFSGTRTQHRMVCAIEDAGFEIRDQIGWLYGTGFPKSLDVSKAIDKAAGAEREVVGSKLDLPGYHLSGHDGGEAFGHGLSSSTYETRLKSSQVTAPATDAARQWAGWGTALKPAWEPICVARKPLDGTVAANVLEHGTGALNIDGCRIPGEKQTPWGKPSEVRASTGWGMAEPDLASDGRNPNIGRWPANVLHDGSGEVLEAFAAFEKETRRDILTTRNSLDDGQDKCAQLFKQSSAHNAVKNSRCSTQDALTALTHAVTRAGQGAITLSDCRGLGETVTESSMTTLCEIVTTVIRTIGGSASLGQPLDMHIRFGNHASAAVQTAPTGITTITISHWKSDGSADPVICSITRTKTQTGGRIGAERENSPSRFFYSSKASKRDRCNSRHPTVKPISLMRYLCRLVTPPGGLILDPFAGSGTTLEAAALEGFRCIGIEREAEYVADIRRRLERTRADLGLFAAE